MRVPLSLSLLLLSSSALAADPWGLHTGQITQGTQIAAEAGWPDLSFQIDHGVSDSIDVGARASLAYSFEGTTATMFGLGLRAPIRIRAFDSDTIAGLVHVDPGIRLYTPAGGAIFGIQLPAGFEMTGKITPKIFVGGGVDVPMFLAFTPAVAFAITPSFGPSFEYHLDDHIGFGANARFGPAIFTAAGATTQFAFVTQGAFVYRL